MISHFVYKNDERVRKTRDKLALFPSDHFWDYDCICVIILQIEQLFVNR